MIRLLEMIGCPDSTIKLMSDIVATCRVCRMWTRRAPDTKLAIRLSVRLGQCVQVDLLFYECAATPLGSSSSTLQQPTDHVILHVVDVCARWYVAVDIADKTPEVIIDALTAHCLQLHGKPELMI